MSVDKFGHFSSYKNEVLKNDAHKWLGFTVDKDKNVDVHNKRIKNVRNAVEDYDAVNKAYLFLQIHNEQNILRNGIKKEINRVRNELLQVKDQLKNILNELVILDRYNKNSYKLID